MDTKVLTLARWATLFVEVQVVSRNKESGLVT